MIRSAIASPAAELLLDQCADLELKIALVHTEDECLLLRGPSGEPIEVDLRLRGESMIEQVLSALHICFETLPILTIGESKEIRLLTPKISLARLLPTAYSFTENRYGQVPGTEVVRARFSAAVFRQLTCQPGPRHVATAFLSLIENSCGPLLAEHVVDPGNIEVRVKRYHVGSPLYRYRFTERHSTAHGGPPLVKWSRFDPPVVCFDWRNPLRDESGNRLADEPLSDDYAGVWLDDPLRAKQMALDAFLSIESIFSANGLKLIDICFFIDRTGTVLFGEISPDCMRVRSRAADDGESLDKDRWRSGGEPQEVLDRYLRLYDTVFGNCAKRLSAF